MLNKLVRKGTVLAPLIFLFFTSVAFGQTNLQDVVYLKNGSVIRGTIIEQIPNQSIKLKTVDGNIFVYKMEEVEKISKETPQVQQPFGGRRGFYLGADIDPAITDVYIDKYKNNLTANGKFSEGISVGGYVSEHVGLMSGLRIEQYSSTFKNVAIGYTTYYSYYSGYYTTYAYGDEKITLTYLSFPLLLTCISSSPGQVGFYLEVGPEMGVLLSAKETLTGDLNETLNDKSGLASFQLYGHLMMGIHIPLLQERLNLNVGPYLTAGLLNEATTSGNAIDNAAIGFAIHLDCNIIPHK